MTNDPAPAAHAPVPGASDTLTPEAITPEAVAALLDRLRTLAPRVHSMTNIVAQNFTANLLLAAGAVPSMTIAPDEVSDFTARSGALLVNIGTLDPLLREAAPVAVAAARRGAKPWLLDPVLIDRSDPRLAFARDLAELGPAVIRANALEFRTLAGRADDDREIRAYAAGRACVVAVTGEVDRVTDGKRLVRVSNGHPLMAKVTAVGCAGTALIGAFCAVEPDALLATVAGLVTLGVAGEIAAREARGPGSFAVALLDALHGLDGEAVVARARLA